MFNGKSLCLQVNQVNHRSAWFRKAHFPIANVTSPECDLTDKGSTAWLYLLVVNPIQSKIYLLCSKPSPKTFYKANISTNLANHKAPTAKLHGLPQILPGGRASPGSAGNTSETAPAVFPATMAYTLQLLEEEAGPARSEQWDLNPCWLMIRGDYTIWIYMES